MLFSCLLIISRLHSRLCLSLQSLDMVSDSVPNVRRLAAKALPSLKRILVLPTDNNVVDRLTSAAQRLSLDGDNDVCKEAKTAAELLTLIEVPRVDSTATLSGAGTERSPQSRSMLRRSSVHGGAGRSAAGGVPPRSGNGAASGRSSVSSGSGSSSVRSRSSDKSAGNDGRLVRRATLKW